MRIEGNNFTNSFCLKYKRTYFSTPVKTEWKELVAQLVEQYTFNVWALGSNPSGITKETYFQKEMGFLFLMMFKMYFDKLEKK